MSRLFLIRHGEPQSAWGAGAADDPGLSETGARQAVTAATELLRYGTLHVVSSPMRRCQETAEPFARAQDVTPFLEPRVSEVATPPGVSDRRTWLLQNFPWQGGSPRHWRELSSELNRWRADMLSCIRALQQDTAIFTHFIAINVIVGAALARDETIVCTPGHASITELAAHGEELSLVSLGQPMHAGDVR